MPAPCPPRSLPSGGCSPPHRRQGWQRACGLWPSLTPAGLAQTFEHVGVVLRPKQRREPSDIHVERAGRDRDGLVEGFLCFFDAAQLAQRGGKPAVGLRVLGKSANCLLRVLGGGFIGAHKVMAQRDVSEAKY